MIIENSAPSNIALIKYMGKLDTKSNVPTNHSISWTMQDLRTFVRVSLRRDLNEDSWQALERLDLGDIVLSESSKQRFLNHFQMLKDKWQIKENFLIESANNFPSDCGLASSASSFAALTKTAVEMFQRMSTSSKDISAEDLAALSRLGSGSSCRSFFAPFALWGAEGVKQVEFANSNQLSHLLHQVVVVEAGKKSVSSSEAHKRVTSSPLFQGRIERAEARLQNLLAAFETMNWKKAFEICWAEFWDMHALFETSGVPFGYMEPGSIEVLQYLREFWKNNEDGPLVTMDAGANVHCLWRADQSELASKVKAALAKKYSIFSSQSLRGSSGGI